MCLFVTLSVDVDNIAVFCTSQHPPHSYINDSHINFWGIVYICDVAVEFVPEDGVHKYNNQDIVKMRPR